MAKAKYKQNSSGKWETKVWDGTYNPDGSKHRKKVSSAKSSADLERKVNQLRNEVENGSYVQKTDITFLEYARLWLTTKKSVREKNTQKMYENIIETHLSFLEGIALCDIRNIHFQLAINNALDKPRTCEQIEITFKQVLKMAVADNYIGAAMYNKICEDINLPPYIKKEKRPLTPVEKDAITHANFTDRERAFVYIIYSCGLRRGEALALSKFDFKTVGGKYFVSVTKTLIFPNNASEIKNTTKSINGTRTLPIPDTTAVFLKRYIDTIPGTYLFTCRDGSNMTSSAYAKMWQSIVRKINYAAGGTDAFPVVTGLTAHIFRHNYCTNLCYQVPAISIKKIAQLMGDTEKMVLNVYNHIMEEKEDAAKVVNDTLAI